MRYDVYSRFHGKIPLEKIVPKLKPLWEEEIKKQSISRVHAHVRAGKLLIRDLFTSEMKGKVRSLPKMWSSPLEISCRNYTCPYPFNVDPFESGGCYQCCYCFSIYAKSSLYSSWFDGNPWIPRFPPKGLLKKELTEVLSARGVEPNERDFKAWDNGKVPKWCGSISDPRSLKKAAAQRIPIRMGNRSEPFFFPEKEHGASLEALETIREFDYPLIINTKSDLLLEEPYFGLITGLSKAVIQVSIIHSSDAMAKRLEPIAPSSSRRWEVIKKFNEVGVQALPRLEPIMAFINADDEHLEGYAEKAKECGVKYCLMDSYSFTTRSPEITRGFLSKGFDFDRMFNASSEYQILGSYIIEKASYYLKQRGIKTSTFNYHTIPYNDASTCCAIDPVFGNWYHYNNYSVTDLLVDRKKLTFTEFDNKYFGEELAPEIRQKVRDIWNLKSEDPWCPLYCEGAEILGVDEHDDLIYGFNPKLIGHEYEELISIWRDLFERI